MMWTASALAAGRLGAGALGRPRFVSRILGGGNKDQDRSQVLLVRAFAIRDLALGVATMGALRRRSPQARQLLLIGALCDLVDAVLIARHREQGRSCPSSPGCIACASCLLRRHDRSHVPADRRPDPPRRACRQPYGVDPRISTAPTPQPIWQLAVAGLVGGVRRRAGPPVLLSLAVEEDAVSNDERPDDVIAEGAALHPTAPPRSHVGNRQHRHRSLAPMVDRVRDAIRGART